MMTGEWYLSMHYITDLKPNCKVYECDLDLNYG